MILAAINRQSFLQKNLVRQGSYGGCLMPTSACRNTPLTLAALLGRFFAVCFLLLAGVLGQAQAASIAFVQSNSADPQAPQATVTVAYTLAQTAGNLNIVVVGWND